MHRIVLRPCNRGRNKRGVCAHKTTKGAKKAKKQYRPGFPPQEVTAYRAYP